MPLAVCLIKVNEQKRLPFPEYLKDLKSFLSVKYIFLLNHISVAHYK